MRHGFILCSKKAAEGLQKNKSVEASALWLWASVLWNTICSDQSQTYCNCSLEDLVDKCVCCVCEPMNLISGKTETTWPLQYGSRSDSRSAVKRCMTQLHSTHLPCLLSLSLGVCACVCMLWSEEEGSVSLQGFGLGLYVSSEDEHYPALICLVFSTVTLLQISDFLFIFPPIVSLHLVLMSRVSFDTSDLLCNLAFSYLFYYNWCLFLTMAQ